MKRLLPAATLALITGSIATYAGLIAGARWRADEFFNAAMLDGGGAAFFRVRLLNWSPRPLSEAMVALYWTGIRATGRPLSSSLLAILWTILAVIMLASLAPRTRLSPAALIATSLVASFLLGHPVAEMFYWPMGALAYLPAIAAVAFVVLRTATGGILWPRGRRAIACGLIAAACSVEMGAMFTAACSAAFILVELSTYHSRHRENLPARLLTWLLPLAISLAVFGLSAHGRVSKATEHMADSTTYHQPWQSLVAAIPQTLIVLEPRLTIPAVAANLLLFLGLRGCFRHLTPLPRSAWRWQAASAAGLIGAIFLSCAATDYQFGGLTCCQRHDTFRQCLIILLIAVAAAAAAEPAETAARPPSTTVPALLLAAAIAVPFAAGIPDLVTAYRILPANRRAWQLTWRAGQAPGPAMTYRNSPSDPITGDAWLPAGTFHPGRATPWYMTGILLFFHKTTVTVLSPDAPPPS